MSICVVLVTLVMLNQQSSAVVVHHTHTSGTPHACNLEMLTLVSQCDAR